MSSHDGRGRVVALRAPEALVLGLAVAACEAAGAASRLGGYRINDADWTRLRKALTQATFALVAAVDWAEAPSAEQLEAAARDLGVRVLREVLGPAPMAN